MRQGNRPGCVEGVMDGVCVGTGMGEQEVVKCVGGEGAVHVEEV